MHIFTFIYVLIQYIRIDDQIHNLFTYVAHRIMNVFFNVLIFKQLHIMSILITI